MIAVVMWHNFVTKQLGSSLLRVFPQWVVYNSCASSSSSSPLTELLGAGTWLISDITDPPLIPPCCSKYPFPPSPGRKAGGDELFFPELHKARGFDNLHPTFEAWRAAGDPQKSPLRETMLSILRKMACSKYLPFSTGYRGSLMEIKNLHSSSGSEQGM